MRLIILTLLVATTLLLQTSCKEPEPVRIGFLGELTTRAAGLSTSARDGFLLAIEEINASGGINNRLVEGIVQDTRMHRETALNAVRALANQKVSAIVGPMTSQTAVTVVPEINRLQIPIISPTSSTNQLNGIDDYFFRVYYNNVQAAELLAKKIVEEDQIKNVVAIYDLGNKAYTEDWIRHFTAILDARGGSVTKVPFELSSGTLFLDLAKQAAEANPQGVLLLANAVDTAMICQQLSKTGVDLPRYATGWSYSDDLLQFGGKSVEGLAVIQSANLQSQQPSVQKFAKAYLERYNTLPNFPAMHAYDATNMLLKLLEVSTDPKVVRNKLLTMSNFKGVQNDLAFDRFGDQKNPVLHLAHIQDGKFVITE